MNIDKDISNDYNIIEKLKKYAKNDIIPVRIRSDITTIINKHTKASNVIDAKSSLIELQKKSQVNIKYI